MKNGCNPTILPAGSLNHGRIAFLITIDTEGDNLWSRPSKIHTTNSSYLVRFQELCERYALKPTYLTNWEMACCERFVSFGRHVLQRGTAEIGMHLHAWNSPPLTPLTNNDYFHQPYLTEYPEDCLREKVHVLTDKLEETFNAKMVSHRSGRWALNEVYARALADHGYLVDCSVTPGLSWASTLGAPHGNGGSDYTRYPEEPYFLNLDNIACAGASELLEVPMTIVARRKTMAQRVKSLVRHWRQGNEQIRRDAPRSCWLRPNGKNRKDMLAIMALAKVQRRNHVEFMLHSSELMPGGSPTFSSPRSIGRLYDDLENFFDATRDSFFGMTLAEYYERFRASRHALKLDGVLVSESEAD